MHGMLAKLRRSTDTTSNLSNQEGKIERRTDLSPQESGHRVLRWCPRDELISNHRRQVLGCSEALAYPISSACIPVSTLTTPQGASGSSTLEGWATGKCAHSAQLRMETHALSL